jgi:hypothetical protein
MADSFVELHRRITVDMAASLSSLSAISLVLGPKFLFMDKLLYMRHNSKEGKYHEATDVGNVHFDVLYGKRSFFL